MLHSILAPISTAGSNTNAYSMNATERENVNSENGMTCLLQRRTIHKLRAKYAESVTMSTEAMGVWSAP